MDNTHPSNLCGRAVRGLGRVAAVIVMASGMVGALLVVTQDFQIFPGIIDGLKGTGLTVPTGVTAFDVETEDGEKIPVWRVAAHTPARRQIALLFHGNAETLETFVWTQRWFAERGFTSYAATYRGFRGSTGFPSEEGIERDADAALKLVLKQERVSPADIILFGNSMGTGPATYIAAKISAGALALIAPYTSIPDIVRERGPLALLTPFLWYSIPTIERMRRLTQTCVILAHGKKDTIIGYNHSTRLRDVYRGSKHVSFLSRDDANHFDIFGLVQRDLASDIDRCIAG